MEYWVKRQAAAQEKLYNQVSGAAEYELKKAYQTSLRKIQKKMVKLYQEIERNAVDGVIKVSDLYSFNRYYDLVNNMNNELAVLGSKEISILTPQFCRMYDDNALLIGKQLGLAAAVQPNDAMKVIEQIWCADGRVWTDRIWTSKSQLQSRLEKGLIDCVSRGASKDELVKGLMDSFNVGYGQANRIARTELSHIQNISTIDRYEQADIKYYEILSNQADDDCVERNGERVSITQAKTGINLPPFHPNCRCSIIPVIE